MQPRSIRLNQDLRDEFISTVLEEIMPDSKEPTVKKFQEANAQAAYEATYGTITSELSALPSWATIKTKCFFVQLDDTILPFIVSTAFLAFQRYDYIEYTQYYMNRHEASTIPKLDSGHTIVNNHKECLQAIVDWEEKYRALRAQLIELTDTCNTSGQLFKTWPKAMEFAHVFPQPEIKERTEWKPAMDAQELDLGIELSQTEVKPILEN